MRRIGLLVNPIAGMGGAVGLKGTDGEMYQRAIDLGAQPVTPVRTSDFLAQIQPEKEIFFLTAREKWVKIIWKNKIYFSVLGKMDPQKTSSNDTRVICQEIVENGSRTDRVCGWGWTARDIY